MACELTSFLDRFENIVRSEVPRFHVHVMFDESCNVGRSCIVPNLEKSGHFLMRIGIRGLRDFDVLNSGDWFDFIGSFFHELQHLRQFRYVHDGLGFNPERRAITFSMMSSVGDHGRYFGGYTSRLFELESFRNSIIPAFDFCYEHVASYVKWDIIGCACWRDYARCNAYPFSLYFRSCIDGCKTVDDVVKVFDKQMQDKGKLIDVLSSDLTGQYLKEKASYDFSRKWFGTFNDRDRDLLASAVLVGCVPDVAECLFPGVSSEHDAFVLGGYDALEDCLLRPLLGVGFESD